MKKSSAGWRRLADRPGREIHGADDSGAGDLDEVTVTDKRTARFDEAVRWIDLAEQLDGLPLATTGCGLYLMHTILRIDFHQILVAVAQYHSRFGNDQRFTFCKY